MKVAYVYQDEYPWDVRVEKIASALGEEGIGVHIVSRNRTNLPRTEEVGRNIRVHRLPKADWKPARDLMNFPAFFSPFWMKEIVSVIRKNEIDIVIGRDLPLSPAAYLAAKATGKPVILDMAENYPALIRSTWKYKGPKAMDYILRNPAFLSLMERAMLPGMDGVLVVSDESAERVRRMRGGPDRVWVVGNTPILEDEKGPSDQKMVQWSRRIRASAPFIFLYVGFIEAHRGLDVAIRAVKDLTEHVEGVLLVIIGTGTVEDDLKRLAKSLGVEKNVLFAGWIPNDSIGLFIDIADVCLVPHFVTEHTDTTLPNKLFDYMKRGKPVVVTQSKSLSRIVERGKCGFVYEDQSPLDLCDKIRALQDPEVRKRLGANGLEAVRSEFNWSYDRTRLLRAVRESN